MTRQHRGSVRVRTTLTAVSVVGLALLLGSIALVLILRRSLTAEIEEAAQRQADAMAAAVRAGDQVSLGAPTEDEQLIQILDGTGTVIRASPNLQGTSAVVRLQPGESARVRTPLDNERFIAVAAAAGSGRTVIVARALIGVADVTHATTIALVVGLPVLLAVVAATTWIGAGSALAPVESMRQEVDEISATALSRRVPEPPGADEISRLAVTMNRMLGRLERAHASQQRFVADASHELRSPIAAIHQHAEVALRHPTSTTMPELAKTVLDEGSRAQRLVDDLLLLVRADGRSLAAQRIPLDLDDIVLAEARRGRTEDGPRINTAHVSAGQLVGDPTSLHRLVRNLIDNATRYARHRVEIALTEDDQHVRLTVDDDGPGIAASDRERVFDRFVRLDESRARNDGGTGLGLAIVVEVARAHDASATVTTSPFGGARFSVTFPIQRPVSTPAAHSRGMNGASS